MSPLYIFLFKRYCHCECIARVHGMDQLSLPCVEGTPLVVQQESFLILEMASPTLSQYSKGSQCHMLSGE